MKYFWPKKKNSLKNLTLDNTAEVIMTDDTKKFLDTSGWLEEVKKKEEIRAVCHICEPSKGFTSIDELQKHVLEKHRIWKG